MLWFFWNLRSWRWDKLYIVPILHVADFLKHDTSWNSIASELRVLCIAHDSFCQSKFLAHFERSTLPKPTQRKVVLFPYISRRSSQTLRIQPLFSAPGESLEVGKNMQSFLGCLLHHPSSVSYIVVIYIYCCYMMICWHLQLSCHEISMEQLDIFWG